MNTDAVKFLRETLQRLFTKSPLFFKIWMIVSGVLVVITGLPDILSQVHVVLPEIFSKDINTAVAWASRGAFIMAWLTTADQPTAVNENGEILKTTSTKLPFTAAAEIKKVTNK